MDIIPEKVIPTCQYPTVGTARDRENHRPFMHAVPMIVISHHNLIMITNDNQ